VAYFCEQQIDILQIISKNTQSAKNKKASQSQQTTFSKIFKRLSFSGLQIRTGLGGTYSSFIDSRGATLNGPLKSFKKEILGKA